MGILAAISINQTDGSPIICQPGYHIESGICVPNVIIDCAQGYELIGSACFPNIPPLSTSYQVGNIDPRVVDRDLDSVHFNLIVRFNEDPEQRPVHINMRVTDPNNQEVAHEEVIRIPDANDSEYRDISMRISGLQECTTYNFFAYALSENGLESYNQIVVRQIATKGCTFSLASIIDFIT